MRCRTTPFALFPLLLLGCPESTVQPPGDAAITFDGATQDSGVLPDVDRPLVTCGMEGGRISLTRLEEATALLEGCERSLGTITCEYCGTTDASPMSSLRVIDGTLNFFSPLALTSLRGLEQLERIGEQFILRTAFEVEDLTGLGNLREIGGEFWIDGSPLTSYEGASRLEVVGGLRLGYTGASLAGFASLRHVRGDLHLSWFPPAEVEAFLARVVVDGEVMIEP